MRDVAVIVVMGVSGSGKTAVGMRLADTLGWRFIEGDALHSVESIAKMQAGEALTDDDRQPWLLELRARIDRAIEHGRRCVIACSALKRAYREALRAPGVRFAYLDVPPDVACERLQWRSGHFFDPQLLGSQFDALEEPRDAIILDGTQPVEEIVAAIARGVGASLR